MHFQTFVLSLTVCLVSGQRERSHYLMSTHLDTQQYPEDNIATDNQGDATLNFDYKMINPRMLRMQQPNQIEDLSEENNIEERSSLKLKPKPFSYIRIKQKRKKLQNVPKYLAKSTGKKTNTEEPNSRFGYVVDDMTNPRIQVQQNLPQWQQSDQIEDLSQENYIEEPSRRGNNIIKNIKNKAKEFYKTQAKEYIKEQAKEFIKNQAEKLVDKLNKKKTKSEKPNRRFDYVMDDIMSPRIQMQLNLPQWQQTNQIEDMSQKNYIEEPSRRGFNIFKKIIKNQAKKIIKNQAKKIIKNQAEKLVGNFIEGKIQTEEPNSRFDYVMDGIMSPRIRVQQNQRKLKHWNHLQESLPKISVRFDLSQEDDNMTIPIFMHRRIGVGESDPTRGDSEMCRTRKEYMKTSSSLSSSGLGGIMAEYCENPGGSCQMSLAGLATTCVQKYVTKVLTNGRDTKEEFKVPAGCVCLYKRV